MFVELCEILTPRCFSHWKAPYFRQVPESFRLDHIKAISAIKDANMDMHMNLKTHLPDGRQVSEDRAGLVSAILLRASDSSPIVVGSDVHQARNYARSFAQHDKGAPLQST